MQRNVLEAAVDDITMVTISQPGGSVLLANSKKVSGFDSLKYFFVGKHINLSTMANLINFDGKNHYCTNSLFLSYSKLKKDVRKYIDYGGNKL